MIVKVCGMRQPENIRAVEQLGIDWMGFIFYAKSSRFVAEVPVYLPTQAKRVGVFVDSPLAYIQQQVQAFGLNIVQLHGKESPSYVKKLIKADISLKIIKVFSIKDIQDLSATSAYEGLADYFLFDTSCPTKGGSGLQFDWNLLHHYTGHTPFLLSGGIGPESAQALGKFSHPQWVGIDLNSRFEEAPACKDTTLLQTFIHQLKQETL